MLTNEQFQEKLKQIDNGITTDTFYAGNDTFMNCNCKYGHHFTTKAFNLIYNKKIVVPGQYYSQRAFSSFYIF